MISVWGEPSLVGVVALVAAAAAAVFEAAAAAANSASVVVGDPPARDTPSSVVTWPLIKPAPLLWCAARPAAATAAAATAAAERTCCAPWPALAIRVAIDVGDALLLPGPDEWPLVVLVLLPVPVLVILLLLLLLQLLADDELELLDDELLTEVGGVHELTADRSDALDGEPPDVRCAPNWAPIA